MTIGLRWLMTNFVSVVIFTFQNANELVLSSLKRQILVVGRRIYKLKTS
jgi:hypothetical protein